MSGKYQVDVSKLSSKAVEVLSSMGIAVRNKGDDRGNYVTVKSNNPIKPVFSATDEVYSSLIGNGSKAKVRQLAYLSFLLLR
jgi:ATP phosphoribosyltransferase